MTRRDDHGCDGRRRWYLRLALIALFVTWSLASTLHAQAVAGAADDPQIAAAHHMDPDIADHDGSHGQTCQGQGHCFGPAILAAGISTAMMPAALGLPQAADPAAPTTVVPIDRPPILSFVA